MIELHKVVRGYEIISNSYDIAFNCIIVDYLILWLPFLDAKLR